VAAAASSAVCIEYRVQSIVRVHQSGAGLCIVHDRECTHLSWCLSFLQVCKRCTDLTRKKCQSGSSFQAVSSVSNTQTLTIESTVKSIIVRKIPAKYTGESIRSCNHFQWTWCPGVPHNPKCQVDILHNACRCAVRYISKCAVLRRCVIYMMVGFIAPPFLKSWLYAPWAYI
jgi:hypothetical protein